MFTSRELSITLTVLLVLECVADVGEGDGPGEAAMNMEEERWYPFTDVQTRSEHLFPRLP